MAEKKFYKVPVTEEEFQKIMNESVAFYNNVTTAFLILRDADKKTVYGNDPRSSMRIRKIVEELDDILSDIEDNQEYLKKTFKPKNNLKGCSCKARKTTRKTVRR